MNPVGVSLHSFAPVRVESAPQSLSRDVFNGSLDCFPHPSASDFHFIFKSAMLGAAEVRNHLRIGSTKLYFIFQYNTTQIYKAGE